LSLSPSLLLPHPPHLHLSPPISTTRYLSIVLSLRREHHGAAASQTRLHQVGRREERKDVDGIQDEDEHEDVLYKIFRCPEPKTKGSDYCQGPMDRLRSGEGSVDRHGTRNELEYSCLTPYSNTCVEYATLTIDSLIAQFFSAHESVHLCRIQLRARAPARAHTHTQRCSCDPRFKSIPKLLASTQSPYPPDSHANAQPGPW